MFAYWVDKLPSTPGKMLSVLAGVYPQTLTQEELASRIPKANGEPLSHRTGSFSTNLGRLRTLDLIEGSGELRASAELFA